MRASFWVGAGVVCQVVVAALWVEHMFPGKTIRGQVQMPSCSQGRASCLQSTGNAVREQRGPEFCQLLVMLVEWELKSHLSFMDCADTCGIHLTMHWWRTRRKRAMENSFMTHQDHKDWITETAILTRLSLPPNNKGFDWGSPFHWNVNTIWLCGRNLWEWSEFLTVFPDGGSSNVMNSPE